MAGFWNLSQQQIYDENGKPMIGARAYFYAAATTTPIATYQSFDLGLVNKQPNPVITDGYGRWPSVYFDEADGFYRVRVTTAQGVVVFDVDGIPIIGPAGGGGGGSVTPVDPDGVARTGDTKARYGEGFESGWARMNGRTIGSATSGASERANSDTQPLFEWLWNSDPNLVVLGGRGASAAADWASNKQMTLPDFRGRVQIGHDVMGNIAANVVADANLLGKAIGEAMHTLTVAEMPAHGHTGSTDAQGEHVHGIRGNVGTNAGTNGLRSSDAGPGTINQNTEPAGLHGHNVVVGNTGGGAAHNNIQPSGVITLYIRL
jgi:microcystin-dependent protein